MPSKRATGTGSMAKTRVQNEAPAKKAVAKEALAKKAPAKKAVAKEAAAKEATVKSSSQKAISRKRAAQGKKNHLSVAATPTSAASVVSTPASVVSTPASVVSTPASVVSTPASVVSTPASAASVTLVTDVGTTQEEQDTEVATLRAQLAAVNEELRLAREAPADRTPAQIARPRELKNLQAAMGLRNDRGMYQTFKNNLRRYTVIIGLDSKAKWAHRDMQKVAQICTLAKDDQPFLARYEGDWPIQYYLQRHLANQRGHEKRRIKKNCALAGKIASIVASKELWDMGSNPGGSNSDAGGNGASDAGGNGASDGDADASDGDADASDGDSDASDDDNDDE